MAIFLEARSQEKAMELPLFAIEFILTSDGLRVNSEDDVVEFILMWTLAHYSNAKECQDILTKHLWPLVYMSCTKLKEVLVCTDVDHEHAYKVMSDALIDKLETPYGQHLHPSKDGLPKRSYIYPLLKVVRLEYPLPSCVVYLNLRRDECTDLFPSKGLYSQRFVLGGQSFYLSVQCKEKEPHNFGLYLRGSSDVDFEVAVMRKSSDDFQVKLTVKNHKLGEGGWGLANLLQISWAKFMSDDSDYFINGILHLQVKIILNNSG